MGVKHLEDLLCEPSLAAFAIVEEFVDRVLRAEGAVFIIIIPIAIIAFLWFS
ncbi:hypothetical protein [Mastigocladopsis repens]|uniref:hypothetical protein n=1 Tax=Mastigocladopsis repens TaxID=221287 RepID=UPI0002FF5C3D|nr:hypothetical protein [Mastigocladopsis repens]